MCILKHTKDLWLWLLLIVLKAFRVCVVEVSQSLELGFSILFEVALGALVFVRVVIGLAVFELAELSEIVSRVMRV